MDTQTETYRTADFYLVAFLMANDCQYLRVERSTKRVFFHFANPTRCEKLYNEYFNGTAMINVRKYADAIRTEKGLIEAQRGQ